uniref:receptor protein serine/threonine kinase n=1 Tax=Erpetoichthys calabaricus TaxID=27687 RepID=A0A8C4RT76_ERPCA
MHKNKTKMYFSSAGGHVFPVPLSPSTVPQAQTKPKQKAHYSLHHHSSQQVLCSSPRLVPGEVVCSPWLFPRTKYRRAILARLGPWPSATRVGARNDVIVINNGRFATLWKGSLDSTAVVLKIYPSSAWRPYNNETEVYKLLLWEHSNVAKFLGMAQRQDSGELLLGSMKSFLSQNCNNWADTVKMLLSLCQGLAFLHTEIHRDGLYKPAIAHRDLSSTNVVVKADRTCALSDFESAAILYPRAAVCTQVGTPRYMSPEILDGTLNFQDPSSSLKQADVYSLALLLWEISTRCTDLYSDGLVPEYRMAYEKELGANPSLDELISLVLDRERPVVPVVWKETFLGFSSLKEVLEDCWDHDPEASHFLINTFICHLLFLSCSSNEHATRHLSPVLC